VLTKSLQLVLLVGPISHRTSRDRKKYRASPAVAGTLKILQTRFRLGFVLRFDEHQLILQRFPQYLHFVPLKNHMFHIFVTCEVAYHSIRHRCTQFNDEVTIVPDVTLVVSLRELAAHGELVNSFGDDDG
jgi:hypothetical protein